MKFEQAIKIQSENKKLVLYVDNGTAYGELHDFLMYVKGLVVDQLNKAHQEEEQVAKKVKEEDEKKSKAKEDEKKKEEKK